MPNKKFVFPIKFHKKHGTLTLYKEPLVFHCNHFNVFFQRTVEEAIAFLDIDASLLQKKAAFMSAYSIFQGLSEKNPQITSIEDKLLIASQLYSFLGYGLLPLKDLSKEEGEICTPITHYSLAWREKYGKRKKPVDDLTCGYISAVLSWVFEEEPGIYEVEQKKCLTLGDEENVFLYKKLSSPISMPSSPKEGILSEEIYEEGKTGNIDYPQVIDAVSKLPVESDANGLCPCFGVYLVRGFANYYNYVMYEVTRSIYKKTGNWEDAHLLFLSAGHVCGFHTFGGIMESPEWDSLVKPQCKNQEDWIYGIVAVINALGWGRWHILSLEGGKSLELRLDSDYEANTYLGLYGKDSSFGVSFVAEGVAAAMMSLVYDAKIEEKPELNEELYNRLFNREDMFFSKQPQCRSKGDPWAKIEVFKENA